MSAAAFVVGWPIAHSRSPIIHGFWLRSLGLAGTYRKIAVAPADFHQFCATLRDRGFVGGNVTIPHKETAAKLCSTLGVTAQRLGAVNTLWFEGGRLCGDNTDGAGFLGALDQEAAGWDVRRGQAVVLGAGGAARAIVDALVQRGFDRIIVANRSPGRADDLIRSLGSPRSCESRAFAQAEEALPTTDLLVNTTSAGMQGQAALDFPVAGLPAHAVVDDIVYVPRETGLLRAASARGLRTVGGLGMLLHQAVPGFERWFGVRPVVTAALRAAVEADIAADAA